MTNCRWLLFYSHWCDEESVGLMPDLNMNSLTLGRDLHNLSQMFISEIGGGMLCNFQASSFEVL